MAPQWKRICCASLPVGLATVLCAFVTTTAAQEPKPSFQNEIAPILKQHCVRCHHGDLAEGDLSFENAATARLDDIVQVESPDASYLLELITPDASGRAEMPKDRPPLARQEIARIRDWIAGGAKWPDDVQIKHAPMIDADWWSLQPIVAPALPELEPADASWMDNEIDVFVLRRLRQNGLGPSPPAKRRTLIRRLYYDLIGLPPTSDQIESFVNDPRSDAYDRLVDELLDSAHYGERWARHWLDLVHYGDTHGFDKDKLRPNAWPYRDWLIRSLNRDKNYTDFVREQIAGDVLYPDDADAVIATGMLVAGPFDWVGHIEVANDTLEKRRIRNVDRDDMVSTVMNSFVSTTVQCARCHDHKFDPVSQKDYYGMQAVFAAIDRADRTIPPPPALQPQVKQLQRQISDVEQEIQSIESAIAEKLNPRLLPVQSAMEEIDQRLTELPPAIDRDSKTPDQNTNGFHSQFAGGPDEARWVALRFPIAQQIDFVVVHPARPVDFPDTPGFAFPLRWRVELIDEVDAVTTVADFAAADFPNPGDRPVVLGVDRKHRFRELRIVGTRLATRSPSDDRYALALSEVQLFNRGENIVQRATVAASDSIDAGRWHTRYLNDGKTSRHTLTGGDAALAFTQSLQERAELWRRRVELSGQAEALRAEIPRLDRQRLTKLRDRLQELELKLDSLAAQRKVFAAATDFDRSGNFVPTGGAPRQIFLLQRGDESLPLTQLGSVSPSALESLPDLRHHFDLPAGHGEGDRRLALANWITDRDNPLTWRSIVNRVWQHHFGRGLVATANDFGRMGAPPSHPELLDYLAVRFRDGGQSLKQLHRMIVSSATYRQWSHHNPEFAQRDSGNQYLWRMNRRRLDAEQIRDTILAVAGQLDPTMYGPGFRAFGLKDDHSPHYDYLSYDPADPMAHRRSIYRFIVRSVPDPFFQSLDCADPSQIVDRRNETHTALQALTMLNNRFTVHMAHQLGEEIRQAQPDIDQQVVLAFRRVLGREPDDTERHLLVTVAREHSLANVCRILFNSNEFMFVD